MTFQTEPCTECSGSANRLIKGSGKCSSCSGTGVDVGVAVLAGYEADCEGCNGTGACPACGGSGVRPASPITQGLSPQDATPPSAVHTGRPKTRRTLTGGGPPEPTYSAFYTENNKTPESPPRPVNFLHALFAERGGVDVSRCKTTESREDWGKLASIALGFCGSPECGYRWESRTSLDSSADPMEERLTTYNLPGISLEWSYSLNKIGQFGHCAYRHGSLWVEFEDAATQSQFERLWLETFGKAPVWRA